MFCNCMILIRLRYFSSFRITYDYTPPLPSPKGETKAKYKFCRQSWCLACLSGRQAVLPWFPL
jgi:hypothetical protein